MTKPNDSARTVNLDPYRSPGVRVFAGRDRAAYIREDNGVKKGGTMVLNVPDDIFALVPTFLCSLVCDQEHVEVTGSAYWAKRVAELREDHKSRRIHDGLPFRLT